MCATVPWPREAGGPARTGVAAVVNEADVADPEEHALVFVVVVLMFR